MHWVQTGPGASLFLLSCCATNICCLSPITIFPPPPRPLPLQMVTHYISNIIPEQAGHAGGQSISWKIQNRRLLSWICSLHHTKWRLVRRLSAPPGPPQLLADCTFSLCRSSQQLLNPVKIQEWREPSSSSETSSLWVFLSRVKRAPTDCFQVVSRLFITCCISNHTKHQTCTCVFVFF